MGYPEKRMAEHKAPPFSDICALSGTFDGRKILQGFVVELPRLRRELSDVGLARRGLDLFLELLHQLFANFLIWAQTRRLILLQTDHVVSELGQHRLGDVADV